MNNNSYSNYFLKNFVTTKLNYDISQHTVCIKIRNFTFYILLNTGSGDNLCIGQKYVAYGTS